jgi:hypothetical protein
MTSSEVTTSTSAVASKAGTGSLGQQPPWTIDGMLIGAAGELAVSLASVTAQTPDKVVRGLDGRRGDTASQNTAVAP